jgi:hypothetical protein
VSYLEYKKVDGACTIVSKNYIAYARTLCESYLKYHPENDFFVLLVDKNDGDIDISKELFKLVEVEDLLIENFYSIAFRFDVLELNTNVKPSFIQYLFEKYNFENIIYFDPDIYIYQPVTMIYSLLEKYDIVVTPHCISPIDDEYRPSEQDFLDTGVFNLGFIALRNSIESQRLLKWWKKRCLELGFNERQTGLFVDQKWMNLVTCFFENVYVLKNIGCNMAYWNLHERNLTNVDSKWIVNGTEPLIFFHFSGIDANNELQISKYQTRYDFTSRSDLILLFREYISLLKDNKIEVTRKWSYAFGVYSNGEKIPSIARRLFATKEAQFCRQENPFLITNEYYKWAQKNNLLSITKSNGKSNTIVYDKNDWRIRLLHKLLRLCIDIFGVEKYSLLMKYFSYISILRNQKELFK